MSVRPAVLTRSAVLCAAVALMTGCGSEDAGPSAADRPATAVRTTAVASPPAPDRVGPAAPTAGPRPSARDATVVTGTPAGPPADPAGPGRRDADPATTAAQRLQQFILETNARCVAGRLGTAPRRPASPQRLRGYAQAMLPRAFMTLAAVSQVKAPPTQRAKLQRVQRALALLAGFYQQASSTPRGSPDLLAAIAAGEAAARKEARRAALPACAVSGS